MSLYYEAASLAAASDGPDGSLKAKVFGAKNLKAPPAQLYALLIEASKWNIILKEIVERSSILTHERKLTPLLAILLVHDLLLAKRGIAAPAAHPLRQAAERHKTRLQAEFTKFRIKKGFASVEALKEHIDTVRRDFEQDEATTSNAVSAVESGIAHPRWIRINNLRNNLETQLRTTFAEYRSVATLEEILKASPRSVSTKLLHVDEHVPNLLALPANTDLSLLPAYQCGELIAQDKASCFPAYLLYSNLQDGDVLDACAAPGNKTTHLAAIMHESSVDSGKAKIWACERDQTRSLTLQKMVNMAGARDRVIVKAGQDFLKVKPTEEPWNEVSALLLDPSCSGSGIVGRDGHFALELPEEEAKAVSSQSSKKRKREISKVGKNESEVVAEDSTISEPDPEALAQRLESLSAFQAKLLTHAFAFPKAKRVSYSTCSIYDEENENVVLRALQSPIAQSRGWKILKREEQVPGMKKWHLRGNREACKLFSNGDEIAEACIRCSKGTEDGTQGFFVAAFKRELHIETPPDGDDGEEEWEGFEDENAA